MRVLWRLKQHLHTEEQEPEIIAKEAVR